MNLAPYKKLTGLEYDLSKTVQYTEEFLNQLKPNQFLIGTVLEIAVSTTAAAVNHGLQQQPNGWIILDKDANADVWRTDWDSKTITFDATASANIKVWVF